MVGSAEAGSWPWMNEHGTHCSCASKAEGHTITDEAISHLSPALLDHINPYGSYTFDVERELARGTRRPLRPATTLR